MTQVLDRIGSSVGRAQFYGRLDAIKDNPELGIFRFRAQDHWVDGTHTRSPIGDTTGPSPAELLLHALAACLTTTLVHVATARQVRLTEVASTLEGDMDVRGCLGLGGDVRTGFTSIRAHFEVKGDAPAETLREIVERAQARSAISDMAGDGVPVEVTVEA